jgi:hypothetical protein
LGKSGTFVEQSGAVTRWLTSDSEVLGLEYKALQNAVLWVAAGVAQSVEQLIRNEKVGCSIHLSGTKNPTKSTR